MTNRTGRAISRALLPVAAIGLVISMAGMASAAVPLRIISTDPYTNLSSYHQTEVEPDTYSFGSTIVAAFQVGRFSDGGASNLGYATSTDDGATWTKGFLPSTTVYATPPGPWARISDPSVTFDARHGAWMVVGLVLDTFVSPHGLVVNRSTDGGLTFQDPVRVSLNQGSYDKQWMTCDNTPTSPFYGNCYVEWSGNTGITMSRSTDGGLTWANSSTPFAGGSGGQPVVRTNGTVVVAYNGNGMQDLISTDGGLTYTGPHTIATVQAHPVAGGIRAVAGLGSAEVDAAGTIYFVWWDCRFRSGCSSNDIVMTTSTDGLTWTTVVRIPIDLTTSTADHFLPGIGVDHATSGATAHLGLTFYFYPNASCSTSTCKLEAGYVSSGDGGSTWSRAATLEGPIRLTWLPSTILGYMVGDYISTSFGSNGRAYPALANATTTTSCTTSTLGSCHEFMVTARNGLPVKTGSVRVDRGERVFVTSGHEPSLPALPLN